jgi:hypothetical protein
MQLNSSFIEPLLERIAQFGQLNIDLFKLKTLDKVTALISSIIARLFLWSMVSFFAICLSIAAALWLGDILGKNYYGFFIVSGFYATLAIFVWLYQSSIKLRLSNWIVSKILN